MRIHPFQGLVPDPALAPEVACVPYDVVNAAEAAALAAGTGRTASCTLTARKSTSPPAPIPTATAVYARARQNFLRLQETGALRRETEPCLYVYQQQMGTHVQRGLVAGCHVDDYDAGRIKKHEKTRQDKEDDRTRLIDTLGADTGPVFLTYRDDPGVNALVAAAVRGRPQHDFTAPDGIRHTVWRDRRRGGVGAGLCPRAGDLYRGRPPSGGQRGPGRAVAARTQSRPPRRRGVQLVPLRPVPGQRAEDSAVQPHRDGPARPDAGAVAGGGEGPFWARGERPARRRPRSAA
jgi:hypothetical protein